MKVGVYYLSCPNCGNVLLEMTEEGECHCPTCGEDFPPESASSLFKEVTEPAAVEIFDDTQHVQTVFRPEAPKFYGTAEAVSAPVNPELPLPAAEVSDIEMFVSSFFKMNYGSCNQPDGRYHLPLCDFVDVEMTIPLASSMKEIMLATDPYKKLESLLREELSNQFDMALFVVASKACDALEDHWKGELSEMEKFAVSEACNANALFTIPIDEVLKQKYYFRSDNGLLSGIADTRTKAVILPLGEAIERNLAKRKENNHGKR